MPTSKQRERRRLSRNEGEGSRSAAKAYNEATRRFVKSGKAAKAAREAAAAMSTSEADAMTAAEAKGRARARK
jgi:hypothetical protein